ncbi:Uncharacterised protein r2_g2947 [Pycnogonum litorale]
MDKLCERILNDLVNQDQINSLNLATLYQDDHQKIVGAIKSLQSLGNVIDAELCSSKQLELTEEGKYIVENGSHESCLYHAIPDGGILQNDLMVRTN